MRIESIKTGVILAGGKGLRMLPFTKNIPKPMIHVNGYPFLEYLVLLLKRNGIKRIIILLGYLPESIQNHFGDGSEYGLEILYSIGSESNETGTRIRNAESLIDDDFLLCYCDNYWPLDLKKLLSFHNQNKRQATVTVYSNLDQYSQNNIQVNNGLIIQYDKKRKADHLNGVEIGFFILEKRIFSLMPLEGEFSFEQKVVSELIMRKQLSGFMTDLSYHSIGSLERLNSTEAFFKKRRFIFLDRDGVINKKPPRAEYVKNWGEFHFLPDALESIKLLNAHHISVIIISNQAGIARGVMTHEDIEDIHENFKLTLAKNNAWIDAIYYCPHGWDEGCDCRKPKPGMFLKAAKDFSIKLNETYFIGDDERDEIAGNAAGCPVYLVNENTSILDVVKKIIYEMSRMV